MQPQADLVSSPEYQTLHSHRQSPDTAAAAKAFTRRTGNIFQSGSASESEVEACLWRAWDAVAYAAAETPHEDQDGLVDLLKAVQKKDLVGGDLSPCRVQGKAVWREMPVFGAAMREMWNRAPDQNVHEDINFTPAQWINLNAFTARLTTLADVIPAFDFSLYAVWIMRDAFETSCNATELQRATASVWMKYAGDTLSELCRRENTFGGRLAAGGDAYAQRGWKGFNEERLGVWKDGIRQQNQL